MGVTQTALKAAENGATKTLADAVQAKVKAKPVNNALAMTGAVPVTKLGRLFRLLSTSGEGARIAHWTVIKEDLRKRLPGVLAKLPIKAAHFGLATADRLAQLIADSLLKMHTGAATLKEFKKGLKGWRWNIAGRVLFERLVKYHPGLQVFFREMAEDFVAQVNKLAKAPKGLVGIDGKPRLVTSDFGRPLRVVEFLLTGNDDVERQFTDFGFVAPNKQKLWAVLPIELKLPAALGKVAAQFSEFLPRLAEAKKLVAVIEDGGKTYQQTIDPKSLVFMAHEKAQVAVAPLGRKRLSELSGGEVASVVSVDSSISAKHDAWHFRVRLLVDRKWLETIVRLITD